MPSEDPGKAPLPLPHVLSADCGMVLLPQAVMPLLLGAAPPLHLVVVLSQQPLIRSRVLMAHAPGLPKAASFSSLCGTSRAMSSM